MTRPLTRADRDQIIINEAKGIYDPDYFVAYYKTGKKAGQPYVKVRAQPLPQKQSAAPAVKVPAKEQTAPPEPKKQIDYNSVSSKEIAGKLAQFLEENVVSHDGNLNDVENEQATAKNREFVEGVKNSPPIAPVQQIRGRRLF